MRKQWILFASIFLLCLASVLAEKKKVEDDEIDEPLKEEEDEEDYEKDVEGKGDENEDEKEDEEKYKKEEEIGKEEEIEEEYKKEEEKIEEEIEEDYKKEEIEEEIKEEEKKKKGQKAPDNEIDEDYEEKAEDEEKEPKHRCGTKNPKGVDKIIHTPQAKGVAEFGEWPWQAAVMEKKGHDIKFKCGGVLIDEHHVLTAAHCVETKNNIGVRLGEWNPLKNTEFLPHEDYKVEKVLIHPHYTSKSNYFNNIAVLKLSKKVEFKPHINPVCLPKEDDDFAGQECILTGWGYDQFKNGTFCLKETALPVVSHSDCQKVLRKTFLGRFFKLHGGFFCAGGEGGKNSCKGDEGGPLVCSRPDKTYALAGILSWSFDCNEPGVPGVYINVKRYMDWIDDVTH